MWPTKREKVGDTRKKGVKNKKVCKNMDTCNKGRKTDNRSPLSTTSPQGRGVRDEKRNDQTT